MIETRQGEDGGRFYRHSGLSAFWWPSVTTVLDAVMRPDLTRWGARMAADYIIGHINDPVSKTALKTAAVDAPIAIRDEAAAFGTAIHHYIATGELPNPLTPEAQTAIDSWHCFQQQADARVLASETPVLRMLGVDQRAGYGGTVDLVLEINGRRHVVDAKTTNGFHDRHALQVSAYAMAWPEPLAFDGRDCGAVLYLDKRPGHVGFTYRMVDVPAAYAAFRSALRFYLESRRSIWAADSP